MLCISVSMSINEDFGQCNGFTGIGEVMGSIPSQNGDALAKEMYVKMSKINKFKLTYGLFGHNYRVAALSTLYLTVLGIIIPSLKSIGQFLHV